jgi:precorrin-6B methylase 2
MKTTTKKKKKQPGYDDINLEEEYWHSGPPIRFTNPEIRRMLTLARAGKADVFCDFGSGFAQNVIMASSEFEVKKAIGIEVDGTRAWRSRERLKELGLDTKGKIIFGSFEELDDAVLRRVTVLFYGLSGGDEIVSRLQRVWTDTTAHRLIWNDWHPIPEAFPDEVDYPFFLTHFPQTRKKYPQRDWLERVVLQPETMIKDKEEVKRSEKELWEEFAHNMDVIHFRPDVMEYRRRLRKVASV